MGYVKSLTVEVTYYDAEGYLVEETLPATYIVCPECEGRGKVEHSAFSNGITSSEWAEWGHDERDFYLQGGLDVACPYCKGQRVTLAIDESQVDQETLALYKTYLQEEADFRAIQAAERAMGC